MTSATQRRPATIEEALARPEDERIQLIRGTLVEKAAPTLDDAADRSQRVRAEPFDAVEIDVDDLLAADPPEQR